MNEVDLFIDSLTSLCLNLIKFKLAFSLFSRLYDFFLLPNEFGLEEIFKRSHEIDKNHFEDDCLRLF